ncbi:MAG: hypothetical protein ACJA1I_000105 [Zhongshania marina]|jgi:hypothetical protein
MDTTNIELLLGELVAKQDEIINHLSAIEYSCSSIQEELIWWDDEKTTFAKEVLKSLANIEFN